MSEKKSAPDRKTAALCLPREAAAYMRLPESTLHGWLNPRHGQAVRIATDGIDIFIEYAESGDLARAHDGQRPIRESIQDYLRYIDWDEYDGIAARLRLPQFPESAPVVVDPDYAWGQPVLAGSRTPLEAIVNLWKAGEPMEVVAEEYELDVETVEDLCRAAVN